MLFLLLSIVSLGSSQGTPRSWQPVFRQELPFVWPGPKLSLNPDNLVGANFAILDKLDDYKSKAGGFNFKQRWQDPYKAETTVWKQTSNPYLMAQNKTPGVKGYVAVNVPQTQQAFGGLEWEPTGNCLMDGQPGVDNSWFYCVGYNGTDWGHGVAIPSFSRPAKAVELFVMNPKTNWWTLVYRQTLPYIMNKWVVNADDPYSETYAIMDKLESFRNSDGTFEFAMQWPDRYNIWHQTDNPVKLQPVASPTVPGYKAIDVQFTGAGWGGLQLNVNQSNSILEGSCNLGQTWFYCIGWQGITWVGNADMPAYNTGGKYYGSHNVELFTLIEK